MMKQGKWISHRMELRRCFTYIDIIIALSFVRKILIKFWNDARLSSVMRAMRKAPFSLRLPFQLPKIILASKLMIQISGKSGRRKPTLMRQRMQMKTT